jgi:hypothetical protein
VSLLELLKYSITEWSLPYNFITKLSFQSHISSSNLDQYDLFNRKFIFQEPHFRFCISTDYSTVQRAITNSKSEPSVLHYTKEGSHWLIFTVPLSLYGQRTTVRNKFKPTPATTVLLIGNHLTWAVRNKFKPTPATTLLLIGNHLTWAVRNKFKPTPATTLLLIGNHLTWAVRNKFTGG